MIIKIRFNTDYPNGKKWRLIMDGNETLVDEIELQCPCHTSTDTIAEGVVKHHIGCNAHKVEYVQTEELKAVIS